MMTGFEQYTRKTRRAIFLEEMEQVVPWRELCALVEPHYPQPGKGRRPVGVERMLRIYFLQQWFNLSDPAVEEALYQACAPGTSGEKKRLARQRLPKQNTSVFTSGSGHGHDAVEMAIPAKHVYRKRSARYRLALAWLIAAYRLGKAWSLRMSYSCLSLRLSRLSGTVHAAYQKI